MYYKLMNTSDTEAPQVAWTPPKLTSKQRKYVENIVHKGMNQTAAYKDAYNHTGKQTTAYEEASRTARNPQVKNALELYSDKAMDNLLEVARISTDYARDGGRDGASYASVAVQVNNSILDRVHGKAKQVMDITSKSVTISIDLTGVTEAQPQ